MFSRRNLLQSSLAGLAGLFTARPTIGANGVFAPATGFDPRPSVAEINRFAQAINWPACKMVSAISVPFATTPLNFYVRTPEDQLHIPEPQLGELLDCCQRPDGGRAELQRVLDLLWEPSAGNKLLTRCSTTYIKRLRLEARRPYKALDGPRLLPDRVTTPKYVTDIVELNGYVLARILLETVYGLSTELESKLQQARTRFWEWHNIHSPHERPREIMVGDAPQIWTYPEDSKTPQREAGTIWTCYTYLHSAGYIETQSQFESRRERIAKYGHLYT